MRAKRPAGPYVKVPVALVRAANLSERAKLTYVAIGTYADRNGLAFPGRSILARDLGCSVSSVKRAVAELTKAGWLAILNERSQTGTFDSNRYLLRSSPFNEEPQPRVTREPRTAGHPERSPWVIAVTH